MAERMSVEVSVRVTAAPDVVWARLTAHEAMAAWWPGLREVTLDPRVRRTATVSVRSA